MLRADPYVNSWHQRIGLARAMENPQQSGRTGANPAAYTYAWLHHVVQPLTALEQANSYSDLHTNRYCLAQTAVPYSGQEMLLSHQSLASPRTFEYRLVVADSSTTGYQQWPSSHTAVHQTDEHIDTACTHSSSHGRGLLRADTQLTSHPTTGVSKLKGRAKGRIGNSGRVMGTSKGFRVLWEPSAGPHWKLCCARCGPLEALRIALEAGRSGPFSAFYSSKGNSNLEMRTADHG